MPATGLLHEPIGFFALQTNACRLHRSGLFPFYLIQANLQPIKMKKAPHCMPGFDLVPTTGFEPAHLLAPPPQDGVSTNFTTWAMMRKDTRRLGIKQYLLVVI